MAYTIKELESLTGIKAHTIRIWEQRYHFIKPSRTQTNIRTYNNEELKTLLTVALLNKYGYKISKIDDMPHEERLQVALQLPDTDAQVENTVNELIGCMVDLESIQFEEILNRHIREKGLEHTITTLVFQFLEKVGILWQTNKILPVQEHIVSGIIRQKIVTAIEGLPFVRTADPLFVLFLPEEEHHEMGLLFVYYLLRKSGIPVIYLGSNVPLGDLPYLVELKKPRYLYMHLTAFTRMPTLQKFFARLSAMAPDATILASGSVIQHYGKKLPPNVKALVTLQEVLGFVKMLPARG